MTHPFPDPGPMSIAQRAARLVVTGAFVAAIASGPVVTMFSAPAATVASTPFPQWTWTSFRDGTFARELEVHLQERSPIVVRVRSAYMSMLHALSWLESPRVVFGRDGWFFMASNLWFDAGAVDAGRDRRVEFARAMRERLAAHGATLVAAVAPDKERVHGDRLPDRHPFPRSRAGLYAAIQQELAEAGVASVDLAAEFARVREEWPQRPLYYARDTHWNAFGVTIAAQAIQRRLVADGLLRDVATMELHPVVATSPFLGDLVKQLGFADDAAPDLRESFDAIGVTIAGGRGYLPAKPAGAPVALAGTSFANVGLSAVLPLALQVAVDIDGVRVGGGPQRGLLSVVERVERGEIAPRVVVWEFVERMAAEGGFEPWR